MNEEPDGDRFREIFRDNLKKHREELGLTQIELSRRCQYEGSYLGKIERGDADPSLESILRIADALEVDPRDLLLPDGQSPSDPDIEEELNQALAAFEASDFLTGRLKLELENEELRSAEGKLREERNRFRGFFEQAPVALLLLDPEGRVRTVNQRARRLMDLPSDPGDAHLNSVLAEGDRDDFHRFLGQFQRGTDRAQERFRFRNRQDHRWEGIASAHRFTDREGETALYFAILPVEGPPVTDPS